MTVVRGCGTRVEGGVYAEAKPSDVGMPLDHFLLDPPKKIDLAEYGLSSLGVRFIQDSRGVTHIIDVVGKKFYPRPADFIEEVRLFGLSRRMPKVKEISLLTKESKIILVHERAFIENASEFQEKRKEKVCTHFPPKGEHIEEDYKGMCVSLLYEDITPDMVKKEKVKTVEGETVDRYEIVDEEKGIVLCRMPSFEYESKLAPEGVKPKYSPAIFLVLSITNLAVIRDHKNPENHEKALNLLKGSDLPVELLDF